MMRCIVVNGAKLKAEALCAHCGNKVGESYVREIGTGLIYCDFHCYSVAVETSVGVLGYRAPAIHAGARSS
jgi:hypothetical protein